MRRITTFLLPCCFAVVAAAHPLVASAAVASSGTASGWGVTATTNNGDGTCSATVPGTFTMVPGTVQIRVTASLSAGVMIGSLQWGCAGTSPLGVPVFDITTLNVPRFTCVAFVGTTLYASGPNANDPFHYTLVKIVDSTTTGTPDQFGFQGASVPSGTPSFHGNLCGAHRVPTQPLLGGDFTVS